MDDEVLSRLIARLYRSVAEPEETSAFLRTLARETGCPRALLAVPDVQFPARVVHHTCGRLDGPAAYRAVLEDAAPGAPWSAPAAVQGPGATGCSICFATEAGVAPGVLALWPASVRPVPETAARTLARLRPHLREWYRLRARLRAPERPAAPWTAVLDHLRAGLLIVDGDACVLHANRLARGYLEGGRGLRQAGGRLMAVDPRCQARLAALVEQTCEARGTAEAVGASLRVAGDEDGRPLILELRPLEGPGSANAPRNAPRSAPGNTPGNAPGNADGRALVWLTDPCHSVNADERALGSCFSLTPSEARVAKDLLDGYSLAEIARRRCLREGTVRQYTKAVLDKTDSPRQGELVRRLALAFTR